MRKSMVILLLAWWLVAPAWGAELPREVRDALPATAEEITEELEDPASLSEGLSRLWDRALGYVEEAVRQSIGGGVVLLAAAVLCALTEECMAAAGGKVHFVPMAGALAITLAAAGSVKTMMGLGQETVEELNTFSKALLPTLSAAVAASGGIVSASVRQVATIFFVDLLLSLIRGLLLPLVYFYVAAAAADAMLPGRRLAGISRAIRKGTVWLLTGALALFTLYLTVSGAAAGSADTVTARLARSAVGVLPVVGSILADAADSVLAGAGAVKNTVGAAGLLAVLAVRYEDLSRDMEQQAETYRREGQAQLELGIRQRTAAYISEKAAQLGLSCHPRVEVTWRGGVPYPGSVTLDMAENRALSAILEEDLGIPPSEQHWLG